MKIQHNISALNTFRQMGVNTTGTAKSLEKLSSGYKINRAGDDAAGLAISEKMRAQIKGLNRASDNAQDGISLIQSAEGALQEVHSILQRMRELGIQAANDVNELEDRNAIQDEINRLKTEVDRIANTTEFNKKLVLNGSLSKADFGTRIIAGTAVGAGAYIDKSFANAAVNGEESERIIDDVYTIEVTQAGQYRSQTWATDLTGAAVGDTFKVQIDFDNEEAGLPGGQTMKEVLAYTYKAVGNADVDNASFINGLKESLSKVVVDYDITTAGNSITLKAKDIGSEYSQVTLTFIPDEDNNKGELTAEDGPGWHLDDLEVAGENAKITVKGNVSEIENTEITTERAAGYYVNGQFLDINEGLDESSGLVFSIIDLTKTGSSILQVTSGKDLTLHVGANTSKDQTIDLGIQSISASSLGIDNIRVSNNIAATAAVGAIEKAIQTVSGQRSALGAVQNRLEHTIANLDTVAENLQDSEARIRDVDMAKEMMNFTKFNILTQASQAMMAQANSLPQGVLQLLR